MGSSTRVRVYQPTASQVARSLLLSGSYLIETSGDESRFFTWKSGIRAPVYCNCRELFGHSGARGTVVRAIASAVLAAYPNVNHIVGLSEAGIVWASCVAAELSLPVAYVSKGKEHGVEGLVVGSIPEDPAWAVKAVIVDDLVASGDTLARAIKILESEKHIRAIGIQSIVNWDFDVSHDRFAGLALPISTLVSYPELLDTALEEGLLTQAAVEELCKFYRNPYQYVWDERALSLLSAGSAASDVGGSSDSVWARAM